jgi:hypothetical protein
MRPLYHLSRSTLNTLQPTDMTPASLDGQTGEPLLPVLACIKRVPVHPLGGDNGRSSFLTEAKQQPGRVTNR